MLLLLHCCAAIHTEAIWVGDRLLMSRVQLVITDNCWSDGLVLSLWHWEHRVRTHQREGISCAVDVGLQTWRLVDPWSFALEGVLPCVPDIRTLQCVLVHRRGSKLGETHEATTVKFKIRIPWWDLMIVFGGEISSHEEWWASCSIWGIILVGTTSHYEGTLPDQDHGLHVILMHRLSPCFHVLSC